MAKKISSGEYLFFFCNKCIVFVRYCQIANLIQYDMQYIPCNSALLAQETLFLTQNGTFFAQRSPKCGLIVANLNSRQISVCSGLKFSSEFKLFGGCHPCSRATSATLHKGDSDQLLQGWLGWLEVGLPPGVSAWSGVCHQCSVSAGGIYQLFSHKYQKYDWEL